MVSVFSETNRWRHSFSREPPQKGSIRAWLNFLLWDWVWPPFRMPVSTEDSYIFRKGYPFHCCSEGDTSKRHQYICICVLWMCQYTIIYDRSKFFSELSFTGQHHPKGETSTANLGSGIACGGRGCGLAWSHSTWPGANRSAFGVQYLCR